MKKLILILLLQLLLAGFSNSLAFAGASESQGLVRAPDFSKLSPECFKPYDQNPILPKDSFFVGATWNDPHVLKVKGEFVMYASADKNFDQNIKIYRLVSPDGIHWTLSPKEAVFEKSSKRTAWDRKSTETPAVVFFENQYYLFYTAYPAVQQDAASYRIQYATSPDGILWTRQKSFFAPSAPKKPYPTLDFRQWIVAEPAPVVVNDQLYLYFTALGADLSVNGTLQTIGLVKSSDGINWSEPQRVLVPDQTLYSRKANWKGYSTPNAVVLNGDVHLFFDVVTDVPFEQVKIHHAVSKDGMIDWKQDQKAIFDRSEFSPWGDVNIAGPSVLLDGNTLMLWFFGHGTTANFPKVKMGIGLATCEL